MNRIHPRLARDAQNIRDVEVGLERPAPGSDEYDSSALVRCSEKRSSCDRSRPSQAELARRPHDADGDFARLATKRLRIRCEVGVSH